MQGEERMVQRGHDPHGVGAGGAGRAEVAELGEAAGQVAHPEDGRAATLPYAVEIPPPAEMARGRNKRTASR